MIYKRLQNVRVSGSAEAEAYLMVLLIAVIIVSNFSTLVDMTMHI